MTAEQIAKKTILAVIVVIVVVTLVKLATGLRTRFSIGERVEISHGDLDVIEREHLARYEFAKQYCEGKTVADIASGTGFGMEILRTVATEVDGYDKEDLGQKYIIDLDHESWDKRYDVIVSFETIEHLKNLDFFLENIRKTTSTLLLSTPLGGEKGWSANPYHEQVWTAAEIWALLDSYFSCTYLYQVDEFIGEMDPDEARMIVVICEIEGQRL